MRYIKRLRFPARYRRPPSRASKRRRKLIALGVVLFFLLAVLSEWGLSSISPELTYEIARAYVLEEINEAVDSELADGESSFVSADADGSGRITAVSLNTAEMNALKTKLISELSKSLTGKAKAGVPIGSLTSIRILNGRGFNVPVKLKLDGSVDISFDTELISAGINQSCHRVTMTIEAKVYSQSKSFETYVETQTSTVLAETVIVGEVPQIALTQG